MMARREKKRILVTGGAGFLGSHLCERLLAEGHAVLCLDNLSTGSVENVAHLLADPDFALIRHDVVSPLELGAGLEEIYNLACPASPRHYQSDPVQTVRTSVVGAFNLLEVARDCGAKILQASTSEVYGDPAVHPQSEGYVGHVNPIGPRACYDEGKRCAETLFFDAHRRFGLPIKVARIFNTYGPRMHEDDGRIVSNFVVQALTGAPITVYGDGSQTRSFCYVSDMIEGLMRLMSTGEAVTGPINLGNPDEVSVLDLAQRVIRLTGTSSRLEFRPLPVDDPRRRRPAIDNAARLLGWRPRMRLEEGLCATIETFRRRLQDARLPAPVRAGRALALARLARDQETPGPMRVAAPAAGGA
jgi:UDP-glucuronate decarboxylase